MISVKYVFYIYLFEKAGLIMEISNLYIYPFTEHTMPLCRFNDRLQQFDHVIPIVPHEFGFLGGDAGIVDKGPPIGAIIEEVIPQNISKSDALLLCDPTNSVVSALPYQKQIQVAQELGIRFLASKKIVTLLKMNGIDGEIVDYPDIEIDLKGYRNLQDISVPVIIILGTGKGCGKFNTQLMVSEMFIRAGYRVAQIASKEYSSLFGISPFPSFMFDESKSSLEKIQKLNQFAVDLIDQKNAEVLIVGVPGGIMPISKFEFNEFGELAYLISHAIPSDIGILNVYYQECNTQIIKTLIEICKFRFNIKIKIVAVSNKVLYISPEEKKACDFYIPYKKVYMNSSMVSSNISDAFLLNLYDKDSLVKAENLVMEELIDKLFL